ncbi:MAG: hypothetical protein IVW55_06790 [Chloroflexi bacterium]|nr:hypothetical protein [Chloroflexota bacterium]
MSLKSEDFRSGKVESSDVRVTQFSTQVITEQIRLSTIQRSAEPVGRHFEGQPGMVTTSNMVTLRTSTATPTRFSTRELLQLAVKLFDLPTHLVLFLNRVRGRFVWTITSVTIGDHPFNVAICGNYLERPYPEGHLTELDYDPAPQLCLRPLYLPKMYVAPFFGQAHQPVALESGDEHQTKAYHQLEVVDRGVPTVEEYSFSLYPALKIASRRHELEPAEPLFSFIGGWQPAMYNCCIIRAMTAHLDLARSQHAVEPEVGAEVDSDNSFERRDMLWLAAATLVVTVVTFLFGIWGSAARGHMVSMEAGSVVATQPREAPAQWW